MENGNQLEQQAKKPIVYKLELETYLASVQEKADKISDKFVIMFFVLGVCLAPVYDTWIFTIANSVIIAALYLMARFVLINKFVARMIISLVYAIFMLQFIGQMHGMAEIHFFFFTNVALLIIYQDWRIMIPYTVFAIGHHSVLAILQANATSFNLENVNLGNYFIGFQGRTFQGESVPYITTFQLIFHFGLASMMAFICGWWAMIFRENSILLIEKQLEEQSQNEELRSSEEELRQNSEQLQNTNNQMQVIQQEIEEKQKLLNRAEKLVGLASYEIDLATQKLTHSDNLPFIYGEDTLEDMEKIIKVAHLEDVHKVVDTLTQAGEGKIEKYDISYRSKGSNLEEYKHYRAVGELIRDAMNNPEKLVGTVQDVTTEVKQKQNIEEALQKVQASEEELQQNYETLQTTQEELETQKQRLEQIFDGVPAMIYQFKMTKDGQMSFPVVSKGSEVVYGLPPRIIMNDASSIVASIDPEDIGLFQTTLQESAQNLTNWSADLRVVIDGKTQWVRGSSKPIKDKEESIIWSGIIQEVTKQKELEQEIQAKNKELQVSEENLKQNLEQLQNTQSQLIQAEKMASLGQLIANIAHEINTPLGAIRSSAVSIEEVLNTTLPSLSPFLKKLDNQTISIFNTFIHVSVKKIDVLSSREKRAIKYDLIEEFEQLKIQNSEDYADWIVDMNMHDEKEFFTPLLKDNNAREIFQTAYQLSNIIRSNQTIKTATDRAAKIVFALKNYVRQDQTDEKIAVNINQSIEITLTLYHNQIKHGIDVTRDLGDIPEFMGYPDELVQVWTNIIHNALQAMSNKGRLFIQTSVENNKVLVCIQDTGGGIPKEVQSRVFDAFFTTKSAGQGSGLGLDITKKIIEKHNGKIWFESLEGKGTTFFIEIPFTDK